MTNSVIGALRVTLGMDSAAFETGLGKASRSAKGFSFEMGRISNDISTKMGSLAATLAAGFAGILGATLATAGRQALGFADDLATAADQVGVNVERFQTLKQSFRALEISGDMFDKSLRSLVTTLGDVQNGTDNAATQALDRMGIKTRILNGEITTTDQLLDAIADSAGIFGSQAEFAASVTDIFGKKAGPQLAAALRNGSSAIKSMEADLRSAGTVLTEQQINKLAEANEVIDRWQENASYRMAIFAADALTSLEKAGAAFDEWIAKRRAEEDRAAKDDNWFFKGLRAYGGSRRAATSRSGPIAMTNPANGADVNRRIGFNVTDPVAPSPSPKPVRMAGGGGGRGTAAASAGGGARAAKEVDEFAKAMQAMQKRAADARAEFDLMEMSLNDIDLVEARLRMEAFRFEQEHGSKWTKLQSEQYREAARELRVWSGETARLMQLQADIASFALPEFDIEASKRALIASMADLPDLSKSELVLPMLDAFSQLAAGVANSMSAMESSLNGFVSSIKKGDIIGIIGNLANLIGAVVGTINGVKSAFGGKIAIPARRAAGGPITRGRPYLVGELGPELVIPNTSGAVIPNRKLRGQSGMRVQVVKGELFDVIVEEISARTSAAQINLAAPGIASMGSTGAVMNMERMRRSRLA